MLDIPDDIPGLEIEDAAPTAPARATSPAVALALTGTPSTVSPLRPWGMWGGLGTIGLVCAAGEAHAVSVVGRTVGGR